MNILPNRNGTQERFEVARSTSYAPGKPGIRMHVVCREDRFYEDVPYEVRRLGLWSVIGWGDVIELLTEHRRALAQHGFVMIEADMLSFSKRLKGQAPQSPKP